MYVCAIQQQTTAVRKYNFVFEVVDINVEVEIHAQNAY